MNCQCGIGGQFVNGRGNLKAKILLVGEAPGKDEAIKGEPFVGQAGMVLANAMQKAGMERSDIYITNAVKCRPPQNRTPTDDEITSCEKFLLHEIAAIKPKVIVCLGSTAMRAVLGLEMSGITKVRGRIFLQDNMKVIPTLHPAYILRNPSAADLLVMDLVSAMTLASDFQIPEKTYTLLKTVDDIRKVIEVALGSWEVLCFDFETSGLSWLNDKIIGVSITNEMYKGWYIPLLIKDVLSKQLCDYFFSRQGEVMGMLKELLESGIPKVNHNIKFDMLFAKQAGISVKNVIEDTYLTAYLLDERKVAEKGLDSFSNLRPDLIGYKHQVDRGSLVDYPIRKVSDYACADVDLTLWLQNRFRSQVESQGLEWMAYEFMPTVTDFLVDLEHRGFLLDVEYAKEQSYEFGLKVADVYEEMQKKIGKTINANSSVQVKAYFASVGVDIEKTGEKILETLEHPVAKMLVKIRQLRKMQSTYFDGFVEQADEHGRVHSSYSLGYTDTGRLASREPNMQNVPARNPDYAKLVKRMFIASPDHVLIGFDYSQAELRIAAWYAQDELALAAIERGVDFHTFTASLLFKVPESEVTKAQRSIAKNINFAILYGAGAAKVAQGAGISEQEAKQVMATYFRTFSKFRGMIDQFHADVKRDKFVTSRPFGRRFRLPNVDDPKDNGESYRASVNYPIQHDASTYAAYQGGAMVTKELRKAKIICHPVNIVHDAVYFECFDDPKMIEDAQAIMKEIAVRPLRSLNVKMDIDLSIGKTWAEL